MVGGREGYLFNVLRHWRSCRLPLMPGRLCPYLFLWVANCVLAMFRGCASRPPSSSDVYGPWNCRSPAAACCSSVHISAETLAWISTGATVVLMLTRGTAIQKVFLVPLFALQAPSNIISWIRGDHGQWTAFLMLLVRLFYFIPGDLELALSTLLFVGITPLQLISLRMTHDGAILSLTISGYLTFQHLTRMGSVRRAFDHGAIVTTLSTICITLISLLSSLSF